LLFSIAAAAETPARVYTWAGAVEELPALSQYTPLIDAKSLNTFGAKTVFARVGGRCVALARQGSVASARLAEGSRDGHAWRWDLTITLARGATTIDGPVAIHGLDRVGDGRTFRDAPKVRTFVAGALKGDRLSLLPAAFTLEIACWGEDTSTSTCADGGKEVCKRCSVLRILGGPLGGQKVLGDGVIHADLTRGCGDGCRGAGLRWIDFESLAGLVKRTPVVVAEEEPAAVLFATKEACSVATGVADLAPDFKPVEPAVPPQRR
jgi:hypothetical protein